MLSHVVGGSWRVKHGGTKDTKTHGDVTDVGRVERLQQAHGQQEFRRTATPYSAMRRGAVRRYRLP
jgi:hypothetical protein